jgi:hypothetical protein
VFSAHCARKSHDQSTTSHTHQHRLDAATILDAARAIERVFAGVAVSRADFNRGVELLAHEKAAASTTSAINGVCETAGDVRHVRAARVFAAAVQLCAHIWKRFTELSSHHFWDSLRRLSFVPVWRRGAFSVVRYADVCVWSDRHLAWSAAPLLTEATSPPVVCHARLGLRSPPPPETVLAHVVHLCARPPDAWARIEVGAAMPATTTVATTTTTTVAAVSLPFTPDAHAVLTDVFSYLNEHWSQITPAQRRTLRRLPLVPVGARLVRASRLYFRLARPLAPFVFEAPRHFGAFDRLFRRLGTRRRPRRRDYVRLLRQLHAESGDRPLNVNELRAVVAVVRLLSQLFAATDAGDDDVDADAVRVDDSSDDDKAGDDDAGGDGDGDRGDISDDDLVLNDDENTDGGGGGGSSSGDGLTAARLRLLLFIPDERGVLRAAAACVFNDAPRLARRIDHTRVCFAAPQLSAALCVRIGVVPLSQRVVEVLNDDDGGDVDDDVGDAAGDDSDGNDDDDIITGDVEGGAERRMRRVLASSPFAAAVARLLEDAAARAHDFAQWRRVPSPAALRRLLTRVRLRFRRCLRTRLLLRPSNDDVTGGGGGDRTWTHTDYGDGGCSSVITVRVATGRDVPQARAPLVASALAALLKRVYPSLDGVRDVAPLAALLAARRTADVASILARLDVFSVDRVALRRGVPGERLSRADADAVELRPLRAFAPGETVAVVADVDDNGGGSDDDDDDDDGDDEKQRQVNETESVTAGSPATVKCRLVYGTVSHFTKGTVDGVVGTVRVRVAAARHCTLLSTEVYAFRTHMDEGVAAGGSDNNAAHAAATSATAVQSVTTAPTLVGTATVTPLVKAAVTYDGGEGVGKAAAAADAAVDDNGDDQDGDAGGVRERARLLAAVDELLTRCGLPLSMEAAALARKQMELQAALRRSAATAAVERKRAAAAAARVEKARQALICGVCQFDAIDRVLVPCGHQLCAGCVGKLEGSEATRSMRRMCPFCRLRWQQTVPFFSPLAPGDI